MKICGVTNLGDAALAADLGAWAVGMVFADSSPRKCSADEAMAIGSALKRQCEVAGVFVNSTIEEITRNVDQNSLTIVQLHGDEGPIFCDEVQRKTGAKVMKALHVKDRSISADLLKYRVSYVILDNYKAESYGGTGETFDWRLASQSNTPEPLVLSGGLNPGNVGEGIEQVQPYAVDVASGVELAPGRKDPNKVAAFFESVRVACGVEIGSEDGE